MTAATDRKAPDTLFAALAAVQAQLPKIGKGQTADTGKYIYKYADLADVSQEILPRLGAAGLAFTSRPTMLDGQFVLAYSLVHFSGEREDGIYPLPSSGTPQQIGSAITYARRYCLCAVTGVAPDSDDDDGAAAEAGHHQADAAELGEDGWPRGTVTRHNSDTPEQNGHRWADLAIEQAASFKSEAEGTKLWKEATARHLKGECTRDEQDHIQHLVEARIQDRRREASGRILRQLSEDDPWRAKVEELSDGDIGAARAALEELAAVVPDQVDMARGNLISRAIIARFPKAAVNLEAVA